MNPKENAEVTKLIESYPEEIQELLTNLRKLIFDASPEFTEEVKWSKPSYDLNGLVCYLAPAKKHVNLGFYQGAEISDPEGLLQGTGKQMRHIQVKKLEEIKPEAFISLIHEAITHNSK